MADKGKALSQQAALQPTDIVSGLGAANRELLATCIALFEDTALRHRVGELFERLQDWGARKADSWKGAPAPTAEDTLAIEKSVRCRAQQWREAPFTDPELRLVLWIYLREAFELPARTCVSTRAAAGSCNDLTAALLHSLEPGWFHRLKIATLHESQTAPPMTLDAVARQTLEELMQTMLDSTDPKTVQQREKLMADARNHIEHLRQDDCDALLRAIGADEINDAAIRKILLTGGGLTLFSASVGWAGFSAYILAAQASAFIPLVSGPALVSLVSVASNPISVIAIAGGGGWWMAKRAQRRISQAVAMRVIALLAMNGLCFGRAGVRSMAGAFRSMETLRPFNELTHVAVDAYRRDWEELREAWQRGLPDAPVVAEALEQPSVESAGARIGKLIGLDAEEVRDTVTLSLLAIGDVLWHMFAIDPAVVTAADFSHVADLGNVAEFSEFSDHVAAMDAASQAGVVDSLKGYVAERLVASQLTDAGYQVEFPADPNQPGWDISVDGVQVQIKDTDSLEYLQQHFEHYGTKYPVIINSEMAQSLDEHHQAWLEQHQTWADHLYVVDGYSNGLVEHVTRQSLDAGATVDHPHVPMFTLTLSAYRNYRRYSSGRITREQAVQQVLLDGGTKMALASVGGFVGPAVGLLVFGPAGALIFGTLVPIVSQMQSRKLQGKLDGWVTSPSYRDWLAEAKAAMDPLIAKLRATLKAKAEVLRARIDALKHDQVAEYLRWRSEDELAGLREQWCRLDSIECESASNIEISFGNLLSWLGEAPVHAVAYQTELKSLVQVFQRRPTLGGRMREQAGTATDTVKEWGAKTYGRWKKWSGQRK